MSDTNVVYDGKIVRLELLEGKWEVVRHADAVSILALNDRGEMVLVKQQRRAVGAFTVEAPAGLVDEGETPEEAARRELQEEVGLDGHMRLLTQFYSSPGFCDERLSLFLATDLREARLPMDEDEDIEVLWLDPREVLRGLREGTLQGSATTVAAALYALEELHARDASAPGVVREDAGA
ncbi:NUDIX domain-containing protein [Deinococcus maricopensis]|uniref:NUDIX hydrolase n=1 Tax=Deinococcus maricopensis (strain DSM 21211 / LMG 22137 / NRRL B-23946 / LB-34) TaxID=709986 RepID=E8U8A2_DEIML|nr:NUDIX hydrolase [Deinococcus maricopensis]ADV67291.1 NUDIX hydrolase [Deinococcus maricopensis DSM 21211]